MLYFEGLAYYIIEAKNNNRIKVTNKRLSQVKGRKEKNKTKRRQKLREDRMREK